MSNQLALLGGKPIRTQPFPGWPIFDQTDEARVLSALRSGKWGRLDGQQVAEFEQRFAEMHGCQHGIAVVNGTVSLRLALMAAGLKAEDEVIVPPYTFYATASAVVEANMIPVFADVDLHSFNLCPRAVQAAITSRTRAIIPVHFAGQPADMDAINHIAKQHNLLVLEDAAHAHGAAWHNRPAGSLGQLASFSFQSSKNLTCGEGGIITTNDQQLADTCRSLHNCGRIPTGVWYEHHTISANYRLGELQGALLNSQLDRLQEQTARRDANGRLLAEQLAKLPGIHPQLRPQSCTRHSYHLFMLRIDPELFGVPRAAVLSALQAEGIPCSAGYGYSLYDQPLFRNKAFGPYLPEAVSRLDYQSVHCPNSDVLCRQQAVWLGQSLLLGSQRDTYDIANAFEKIQQQRQALLNWSQRASQATAGAAS
ncbi:MAG: DegT/DnrJ/EryC1/StrS family aminotransferase [Pirellulaceae bacterium]|nr:DegT/DnrJ/EryC1/StrS family aminotransferase [Pirellulaceae bacterium]